MATLTLQNFTTMVSNSATAAQASCAQLLDFTVGSVLRAIIEANATIALWQQWLILQVLALTRAATSQGANLDSWMADFSFTRLAATQATGTVTLYRYTTGSIVTVAPGPQVKTGDTTQTFTILADTANTTGFWNSTAQAYQISGSTASMNVLVQAVNYGTQGNVLAGAISLLSSSIPGIDYCLNAAAFTNALNAESDAAFRTRFALYINTRSLTTALAVQYAATSVQQGVSCDVVAGAPGTGSSTVYVDDGSGATPSGTIAQILTAVNAVRAVGTNLYVLQAPVTSASINIAFTSQAGYVHATQIALINTAVTALIGALTVGQTLSYSSLAAAVYGVGGVLSTQTLTINGSAADLAPGVAYGVVRLSAITVA
jgi:uncharacterized phage protein gp47/JayE